MRICDCPLGWGWLLGTLLCGCGRAPAPPIASQPPAQQEQFAQPAGTSLPEESPPLDAATFPSPSAAPVASVPQFAKSGASEAAQAYAAALSELKNQPTPPATIGQDALTNPASITASLNQLAAKLNALGAAKQQVEANLAPSERQRWKEFQRSLDQSSEQ